MAARDDSGGSVRSARPSSLISLLVMAVALAAVAVMAVTGEPGSLGRAVEEEFGIWLPAMVSIQFLVLTPTIFLAEYLWPARPEQRRVGPEVAIDAFYFMVNLPTMAAVAAVVSGPLVALLESRVGWLVLDSTADWPVFVVGGLGLALADFGAWFAHLLKHRVPLFWRFHVIHHSTARMNLFAANRTHPIDGLIDVFVLLVPFFVLFPSFTAQAENVAILVAIQGWVIRFEHSNVRTNLGPLRWLIVTPQSHRIHHSTDPEHWSSNYATFFAWDRLFGTQHRDVTSYPTTGVNDPWFPEPRSWSPREFAASFVGQMLVPFDTAAVERASSTDH